MNPHTLAVFVAPITCKFVSRRRRRSLNAISHLIKRALQWPQGALLGWGNALIKRAAQ